MLRKATRADIGLLNAMYGRAVGEVGFGPIADFEAAVVASVMDRPIVLPYDPLFGEGAEFNVDVTVLENGNGEFAGFYVCKTAIGRITSNDLPFIRGAATELWYVYVPPEQRHLGTGARLVRDSALLVRSRTRAMGGVVARVTGSNYSISKVLAAQGFDEIGDLTNITRVWLCRGSDVEDDFADIVDRR
jgi:hypothetical protein